MTSLQHHSHHLNHHSGSSVANSSTNNNSVNLSLNNSANNLSPVIQRKIETQVQGHSVGGPGFNRYSSGSVGAGITVGAGADFDTTSIASVSESSHWSGGGGDDLDNVALVNGSDCINTMENKDWSSYLKMAKNGYNSSDEDTNNNENDSDESRDENELDLDENIQQKKNLNLANQQASNKYASTNQTTTTTTTIKNSIRSRQNSDNSTKQNVQQQSKKNKFIKNTNHINKKINKENLGVDSTDSTKIKHFSHGSTNESSFTTKKIRKKISQDSFDSNKINDEDFNDAPKSTRKNSISDEEYSNAATTINENESATNPKSKLKRPSFENEYDNDDLQLDDSELEDDIDEEDDDVHSEEDEDDDDDDDDLDDDDIWTIKPKLYSYYEKQFKTMEPNLNGFIIGSVAKPFFERSKLPLNELSKIWELSDVTKDGALSFAEFCTAMHLVVLRVRNFDLPNELPEKLQPYAPLIDFNNDAPINSKAQNEDSIVHASDPEEVGSPNQQSSRNAPTGESLVQFSLKPQIPSDVQIAHPVALRYSSNNQYQQQQLVTESSNQNNKNVVPVQPEAPPRHSRSSSLGTINNPHQTATNTTTASNTLNTPAAATNFASATINTPKILQQQPVVPPRITSPPPAYLQQQTQSENAHGAQQGHQTVSGPLLPPPPPPLPHHQLHHYHNQHQSRIHGHSLNHHQSLPVAPATQTIVRAPPPPPAVSNQSTEDISKTIEKLVEQMNILNMERLKRIGDINQKQQQTVVASNSASSSTSLDLEALSLSIRAQTEQNQLLHRVFNELEKELRSLTDNRIALEIKLDYLNTASQANPQQIVTPSSTLTTGTTQPTSLPSSSSANATKKLSVPSTPITTGTQSLVANNILNSSSNQISSNATQKTPVLTNNTTNTTPSIKNANSVTNSKINI